MFTIDRRSPLAYPIAPPNRAEGFPAHPAWADASSVVIDLSACETRTQTPSALVACPRSQSQALIAQAMEDLGTLPLQNLRHSAHTATDIHPNAQHNALRQKIRNCAPFTDAIAACTSTEQKHYARANIVGAIYTQAIVQYGAAQAGSSEYSDLFLERIAALAPTLTRHFSKMRFWQPGDHAGRHSAVLFDRAPRVDLSVCPGTPAPNRTIVLTLNEFLHGLECTPGRFSIIDPSTLENSRVRGANQPLTHQCEDIFQMLRDASLPVNDPALRVSLTVESMVMPAAFENCFTHPSDDGKTHEDTALEEVIVQADAYDQSNTSPPLPMGFTTSR